MYFEPFHKWSRDGSFFEIGEMMVYCTKKAHNLIQIISEKKKRKKEKKGVLLMVLNNGVKRGFNV